LARLHRIYGRLDPLMTKALAVLGFGLTILWYFLFLAYADAVAPEVSPLGMMKYDEGRSWLLLAALAGLLSAFPARAFFMRRLLNRRYPEFRAYRGLRVGFDPRLPYFAAVAIALPLIANAAYTGANSYTAYTPRDIVIERPWAPTISEPYSEIAEVRAVEATETSGSAERVHFEIEFYDGIVLRSDESLKPSCSCSVPSHAIFAASMSGRQITNWDNVKPKDWPEGCPSGM
jgi:hypothetical protein